MLRDTSSTTCWFIKFLCFLLLRLARWYSFDGRLYRLDTTGSPHILPINRCYDWLIAGLVCRDMETFVNILLSILSVEKYVGDYMSTWYASYIQLSTTVVCYGQVNSEVLQTIFNFKLCPPCPISKPPTACHIFFMQSLQNFGT